MEKPIYLECLVQAQLKIKAPKKDKINPRFKTSYCSLDSIYEAIRIPLAEHGFTIRHTIVAEGEKYWLETFLHHSSGETLSNRMPIFVEALTSQGFASALTYSRRYALCSLLGLPTDDDDDGNAAEDLQKGAPACAPQKPPMSEQIKRDQLNAIRNMLKSNPQGEHFHTAILDEFSLESLEKAESPILGKIIMKLQRGS